VFVHAAESGVHALQQAAGALDLLSAILALTFPCFFEFVGQREGDEQERIWMLALGRRKRVQVGAHQASVAL
jgi:hypothetical protein